jgi:hypothetical protein
LLKGKRWKPVLSSVIFFLLLVVGTLWQGVGQDQFCSG